MTHWTSDEVAAAVEAFRCGMSTAETARMLGKSTNGVLSKWRRLGLPLQGRGGATARGGHQATARRWTAAEVQRAVRAYREGMTAARTAEMLGRSHLSIQSKWKSLGLSRDRRGRLEDIGAHLVETARRPAEVPAEQILDLHSRGYRAENIAAITRASYRHVYDVLARAGRLASPRGRAA